jgi:hypothetical protein
MKTVIDSNDGKLLYCITNEVLENDYNNVLPQGQTAINEVCTIETTEPVYWNFETEIFYVK